MSEALAWTRRRAGVYIADQGAHRFVVRREEKGLWYSYRLGKRQWPNHATAIRGSLTLEQAKATAQRHADAIADRGNTHPVLRDNAYEAKHRAFETTSRPVTA